MIAGDIQVVCQIIIEDRFPYKIPLIVCHAIQWEIAHQWPSNDYALDQVERLQPAQFHWIAFWNGHYHRPGKSNYLNEWANNRHNNNMNGNNNSGEYIGSEPICVSVRHLKCGTCIAAVCVCHKVQNSSFSTSSRHICSPKWHVFSAYTPTYSCSFHPLQFRHRHLADCRAAT